MAKSTCIHKGQEIGFSKCGCDGNIAIYNCPIYSFCMQRPIRVGQQSVEFFDRKPNRQVVTMNYCKGCKDFYPRE